MSPRRFCSSATAAWMLASSPSPDSSASTRLTGTSTRTVAVPLARPGRPAPSRPSPSLPSPLAALLVDEHLDDVALALDLHVLLVRLDRDELGVAGRGQLLPDLAHVRELHVVVVAELELAVLLDDRGRGLQHGLDDGHRDVHAHLGGLVRLLHADVQPRGSRLRPSTRRRQERRRPARRSRECSSSCLTPPVCVRGRIRDPPRSQALTHETRPGCGFLPGTSRTGCPSF